MNENNSTIASRVHASQNRCFARTSPCVHFLLALGGMLLATGCSSVAYEASFDTIKQPQMSFPEARQNIKKALQDAKLFSGNGTPPGNVQVSNYAFSFKDNYINQQLSYHFAKIQKLTVEKKECFVTALGADDLAIRRLEGTSLYWPSRDVGQRFVDAVMAVRYWTSSGALADDVVAFKDFQEKAKAWKALAQKPVLAEDARRFKVRAEDSAQKKDWENAVKSYEQGLAIEPLCPDGQLNAARIYGELHAAALAVMHMKRYLELCPDAPDAQKCRDQMYIWEGNVENPGSSEEETAAQSVIK
jgi:tetratricopeptide (TPR) repeat protein